MISEILFMKTENEVKLLLKETKQKIYVLQGRCMEITIHSPEWEMCDREYAKAVAQYNILLEVLK